MGKKVFLLAKRRTFVDSSVFLYGKNILGYKTTLEDIYVSESLQTINRVVDVNERWFSIYLDSDHVSDGSRIPRVG